MIPTYNCARYLEQTLQSVLAQDPGPEEMQIAVVDDCSTTDDPEAVVRSIAGGRVRFERNQGNLGAVANFNRCIELSRGELVHILHGDDFIGENFYREIGTLSITYKDCAFLASRVFFVDETSVIQGVSPRMPQMERPTRDVAEMLKDQFFRTPGVVVRRAFYEQHGGFIPELVHCADWEMWVRSVCLGSGVVHPQPLANYRAYSTNDTGRLARMGENAKDILRLADYLSQYDGFSFSALRTLASRTAFAQYKRFAASGDAVAARANVAIYQELVPLRYRLARQAIDACRRALHNLVPAQIF